MILGLQQGLKADGIEVSLVKLCQWFGVARRTVYYRETKGQPKLQEQFVKPIKAMIEENPSFATVRWRTCWTSTRTRCSGCFSSWAGI